MYEKIQISEEQAWDMLHVILGRLCAIPSKSEIEEVMQGLREGDYTKKTSMDEAENWFHWTAIHFEPKILAQVKECRRLYMTVIQELRDKLESK